MAKRKVTREATRPPTIWDGEKYFDATFTALERRALRDKLIDVCGYGAGNYCGFERAIEGPAQDTVWPVFVAEGFEYERDHARLCDYALIHVCRELGIDYKSFAANVPKLSIAGFIECAKRAFPDFKRPRNKIEATIQEHKLHLLWCDWHEEECARTGCTCKHHWLCGDRFAMRDYPAILEQVAAHNRTRPRFAPLKLVHSRD